MKSSISINRVVLGSFATVHHCKIRSRLINLAFESLHTDRPVRTVFNDKLQIEHILCRPRAGRSQPYPTQINLFAANYDPSETNHVIYVREGTRARGD